jgi:hypothetical protein
VTHAVAAVLHPGSKTVEHPGDQAHERDAERPAYRVHPQGDGGTWRGPTDAAWVTRILRGARPPRASAAMPGDVPVPHG